MSATETQVRGLVVFGYSAPFPKKTRLRTHPKKSPSADVNMGVPAAPAALARTVFLDHFSILFSPIEPLLGYYEQKNTRNGGGNDARIQGSRKHVVVLGPLGNVTTTNDISEDESNDIQGM